MARRKIETPPAAQAAAAAPSRPEHAVPSRSRCPRCGGLNVRTRATDAEIRYLECGAPVCRHRWKLAGAGAADSAK